MSLEIENIDPDVIEVELSITTEEAVDSRVDDIENGTTVVGKATADGSGNNIASTYATKTSVDEVKEDLVDLTSYVGKSRITSQDGYLTENGTYTDDSKHSLSCKFYVNGVESVFYKGFGRNYAISIIWYDSTGSKLSVERIQSENEYTEVSVPSGAYSAIFSSYASKQNTVIFDVYTKKSVVETLRKIEDKNENQDNEIDKCVKKQVGLNLVNPTELVIGYISNQYGDIGASDSYRTTGYINVKSGLKYVCTPKIRKFLAYDSQKNPITSTIINDRTENYVFTATEDGFIRATFYHEDIEKIMVFNGDGSIIYPYELYQFVVEDGVGIFSVKNVNRVVELSANTLYGKKWAVCGDSFSNGDFSQSPTTDYIIEDGLYKGKKKVYGYLIGNRNIMTIQDMTFGGRTLATPSNISAHNCFTDLSSSLNYTQIDSDVDYITLYFGINDSHNAPNPSGNDGEVPVGEIPLGTITDTTPNTFYGAWNVCLPYLIEHYPNAHIGILVSNGCDTDDYRIATIECAKKWGVPYIDLNGDDRTPMMIRSSNPNKSSTAKDIVNAKWKVNSASNGHPNAKCHEFESLFIEEFLRSI